MGTVKRPAAKPKRRAPTARDIATARREIESLRTRALLYAERGITGWVDALISIDAVRQALR